jgi:hypothetical protein
VNDAQLRELLVEFLEERAFNGRTGLKTGTLAERLANAQKKLIANCGSKLLPIIDRLCKRLVALKRDTPLTQEAQKQIRLLEQQIENADTRLRFEGKDGGAALVLGTVYYYYRLGMDSVGAGKALLVKPPHIRQIIWRLRQTWARLEQWRLDPSTRPVPKAPKPKAEPKPKRPPVDIQRAVELLAQRHNFAVVARQLGTSRCRLRLALAKAGVCPLRPRAEKERLTRRPKIDVLRVVALRSAGLSVAAIADQLGFTRAGIRLAVRRTPLKEVFPRTRMTPVKDFDSAKAVELYKAGHTVRQIAVALGYPVGHGSNRVARSLISAGVYRGNRKAGPWGGPAAAV